MLAAGADVGAGAGNETLSAIAAWVTPCFASRAAFLSAQNLFLPTVSSFGYLFTV